MALACLASAGLAATGASARGTSTPRAAIVRLGSPALRPADATLIGSLPRSTPMRLTVALTPRDPAALASYAKAVAEPGSDRYHRYLTVSQFAQRFGAAPATIAAVRASLRARGLTPGNAAPNGLSIPVHGTASDVSTAFATRLTRLRLRGGRIAFANTAAPAFARSVAPDVQAIIGLNTVASPKPAGPRTPPRSAARSAGSGRPAPAHVAAVTPRPNASGPAPCSAATSKQQAFDTSTPYRPYTINQVAGAYEFTGLYTAGDLGSGTTVAVFELEGNFPADTAAYQTCFGSTGTVKAVKVDGGAPAPSAANDDGYETQIDLDNILGLAPKVNLLVYQGPDTTTGSYDTDAAIVAANKASVLSQSWGLCESELGASAVAAEATLFQEAAVQGMTVLAASGDTGSGDCASQSSSVNTAPAVNDPAAQPYVTGVGGTTLSDLNPPVESAWNNPYGASGGGPSLSWAAPSFQTDAAASLGVDGAGQAGLGSCPAAALGGSCRLVPDVSADADPYTGYMIYYDGQWTVGDGTSASTPVWTALVALAEGSAGCGGARLGFINPTLYGGAGAQYAADFNDVVTGENAWIPGMDAFAAVPGYDPVTGLGTPKAAADAAMLCAGPLSVSTPSSLQTVAGTPVTFSASAVAAHGQSVTLSATGVPNGVTFSPATGTFSGTPQVPAPWNIMLSASTGTQVQEVSIPWTVTKPVITLRPLPSLVTTVGTHLQVRVNASVNAPLAIDYALDGLPKGLAISPTGLISGTPRRSGRFAISVTASASLAGPVTSSPVVWIVDGPAQLRRVEISGVARNRPQLRLMVQTGYGVACPRRLTVAPPSGLIFPRRRLASHVSLRSEAPHDHRQVRFAAALRNGALGIKPLPPRSCSVQITISGLQALPELRQQVRRRGHRALRRRVSVVAANGQGPPRRLMKYASVG